MSNKKNRLAFGEGLQILHASVLYMKPFSFYYRRMLRIPTVQSQREADHGSHDCTASPERGEKSESNPSLARGFHKSETEKRKECGRTNHDTEGYAQDGAERERSAAVDEAETVALHNDRSGAPLRAAAGARCARLSPSDDHRGPLRARPSRAICGATSSSPTRWTRWSM